MRDTRYATCPGTREPPDAYRVSRIAYRVSRIAYRARFTVTHWRLCERHHDRAGLPARDAVLRARVRGERGEGLWRRRPAGARHSADGAAEPERVPARPEPGGRERRGGR